MFREDGAEKQKKQVRRDRWTFFPLQYLIHSSQVTKQKRRQAVRNFTHACSARQRSADGKPSRKVWENKIKDGDTLLWRFCTLLSFKKINLPVIALERFFEPAMQSKLQRKPANDLGNLTVVNISAWTHAISWALIGTSQLTSRLGGGDQPPNWLHADSLFNYQIEIRLKNVSQMSSSEVLHRKGLKVVGGSKKTLQYTANDADRSV